jgi:hypothetical protein
METGLWFIGEVAGIAPTRWSKRGQWSVFVSAPGCSDMEILAPDQEAAVRMSGGGAPGTMVSIRLFRWETPNHATMFFEYDAERATSRPSSRALGTNPRAMGTNPRARAQ